MEGFSVFFLSIFSAKFCRLIRASLENLHAARTNFTSFSVVYITIYLLYIVRNSCLGKGEKNCACASSLGLAAVMLLRYKASMPCCLHFAR